MSLILVVEDEEHIRNNICEILTYENYHVIQASNGVQGVKMAQEYKPDLILCDVLMPGLTGWDVLLELRSNADTADVQFVFLTALADRASTRKGMSHGADDYVPKPFTHKELLDSVSTRLKRREESNIRQTDKLDQLRRNIIYALPHELRSPLTGILSCAEFLLLDHDTDLELDRVQNVARIIERSGKRLQRLIENYLYFAQLEMIASDYPRREGFKTHLVSNPGGVIYEASKERAQTHQRINDLQMDLQNTAIAIQDENLQKLVSELVDNACKFSQPGTPILVETRINGTVFAVRVVDQGRGMEHEEVQNIDPFAQFQRTLFEQQGVGLGLAIVRRLTDLYGGQFSVVSQPGQGTDVMVMLPIN